MNTKNLWIKWKFLSPWPYSLSSFYRVFLQFPLLGIGPHHQVNHFGTVSEAAANRCSHNRCSEKLRNIHCVGWDCNTGVFLRILLKAVIQKALCIIYLILIYTEWFMHCIQCFIFYTFYQLVLTKWNKLIHIIK